MDYRISHWEFNIPGGSEGFGFILPSSLALIYLLIHGSHFGLKFMYVF